MATTITIRPDRTVVVVIDDDPAVAERVTILEDGMEDLATRIGALQAQFDGYRADVDAALDKLRTDLQAAINANDPAAANAALDAFSTDMADARGKVGDANQDGQPAAPSDDEPTEPAPGDGGETGSDQTDPASPDETVAL